MRSVSARAKTIRYAAVAVILAAIMIGASMYYVSPSTTSAQTSTSSTTTPPFGQSVLVIQLTDPPQVPVGTSSLNLTYSAVNLLVSEPAYNGQVTISSVSVTPPGGSETVNLLSLQNVSQTTASAYLPTGSAIYTIGFAVESMAISINGTAYQVSLATGKTDLDAILVHPISLNGSAAVLLELNPVVVDTTAGYQVIPSMVGILKPQSEYRSGDQDVGARNQITQLDQQELDQANGQVGRLAGW
jgi:hypothetical protein